MVRVETCAACRHWRRVDELLAVQDTRASTRFYVCRPSLGEREGICFRAKVGASSRFAIGMAA